MPRLLFWLGILLTIWTASGATIHIESSATGQGGVMMSHESTETISNDNISRPLPLLPGQELVEVSEGITFLTAEGSFNKQAAIDNIDITYHKTEWAAQYTDGGIYDDRAAYFGTGSPGAKTYCEQYAEVPYNEDVYKSVTGIGQEGIYSSSKSITVGDIEYPDSVVFDSYGAGYNGTMSSYTSAHSQSGFDVNTTEMNYENDVRERIYSHGGYHNLSTSLNWTSFKNTYDDPYIDENSTSIKVLPGET